MEKRIGFGARLAAAVIDAVAVAMVGVMLGYGLARGIGLPLAEAAGMGSGDVGAFAALVWTLAGIGGFVFLYSLLEAFTGASPGKMALGLRVGAADGQQGWAALYVKRWAIKYSGTLLALLGAIPGAHVLALLAPAAGMAVFIGCFLVLGDKRQALHDIGAATAVFRKTDLLP